jgi:hypothetical protein
MPFGHLFVPLPPGVADNNPHFVGRFTATTFVLNTSLLQTREVNVVPPNPEVAAGPHFVGRFTPTAHTLLPSLRQETAIDVAFVEAQPHFVGRFSTVPHLLNKALGRNYANDIPVPIFLPGSSGKIIPDYGQYTRLDEEDDDEAILILMQ